MSPRDHHVAGVAPDWSHLSHRWNPATIPARTRHPMAVPRLLSVRRVEVLKRRWFAIGSLTTIAVMAIGYAVVIGAGGAL